jgi:cytochrome c5
MRRFGFLVIIGLGFVGCSQENVDTSSAPRSVPDPTDVELSQLDNRMLTGFEAYETVCASCHETGRDGAPLTGDAAAWSGRSVQWEAVLFEHAKSGYLDMPAKGGKLELSDRNVSAAAEYMLMLTYPDRLPDN